MTTTSRLTAVLALSLLAGFTTGCGGKGGGGTGGGAGGGSAGDGGLDGGSAFTAHCTVNPAMALGGACLLDENCPCGAHCQLGTCVAACKVDGDCQKGQHCDGFGRCSSAANALLGLTVDSAPQGTVTLAGAPVTLDPTHLVAQVTLTATGAGLDGVTLRANAGLQLQCGGADGGAFTSACTLPALAVNQSAVISVQVTDTTTDATYEAQVITKREALAFRVHFTPPAGPPPPLEGTYAGVARPIAFGTFARSPVSAPPDSLAQVAIPVTVTIFPEVGNRRVVTLADSLGLIFPDAPTTGELLRDGSGALQLRHPARPFVGRSAGGSSEVDVAVSATSLTVARGSTGLSVQLQSRYLGVIDGASDPFVTWQITVSRQADLADGGVVPTVPTPYFPADPATQAVAPFPSETSVQTALSAALASPSLTTPAAQAQALICSPYGAGTPTMLAPAFGAPLSGDLACVGGTNGLPELTFGLLKDSTWQLVPTITNCLNDLKAGQAVEQGTLSPAAGAGCIDQPRAITAITTALARDRARALGQNVPVDTVASSLGHRLLQQWLRTHLFFAKQSTQVDLLNDVLAGENQINSGFKQIDMLGHLGRGFDFLLTPRVALAITRLPPDVVFTPDYRPRVAPSLGLGANPRHEQPIGLPVTLVDAVQEALGVYGTLYERARYVPADGPALEASAKVFLRKSLVTMSLATMLNDTARANNVGTPTWDNLWQQKRGLYGIALAGLMRSIADFHSGKNPLGIDDKLDLPLYRVGDQVGALNRFSAVSDYLLGTGISSTAIVPARIAAATTALTTARNAWSANVQQDYTTAVNTATSNARQQAIRTHYGEAITSLCGDSNLDSLKVLSDPTAVDPDTCFIKPSCRVTPQALRAAMAPGDVARVVCWAQSLREVLGANAEESLTTAFTSAQVQPLLSGAATVRGAREGFGIMNIFLSTGLVFPVPTSVFVGGVKPPAGKLTQAQLDGITSRCDMVANVSESVRPAEAPASCNLNGDCPGGMACVSGACVGQSDLANQASCYTGSLGSKVVALRAAAKEIEIARAELEELTEKYNIEVKKCNDTLTDAKDLATANESFNASQDDIAAVKLACDVTAKAATTVSKCAEVYSHDATFGVAGTIACGADAIAAAEESVAAGMEFAMEKAQRAHEVAVQRLEAQNEWKACMTEASIELVGTKAATLRIEQAIAEEAHQYVELGNDKTLLRGYLAEGQEALAAEQAQTVPPIALEFWLNADVEQYGIAFRTARRVAYLAVLAVEYEYQLSTIERQNVLAATKVSDLQGVLDRLRNLTATGTVKGKAPANLFSVVSLKGNLLQLLDQSNLPPGFQTLTDVQRFRLLLTSSRFAAYDAAGRYVGQEIPFQVAPLAALKLGNTGGVTLLSGGDCDERVWSVNASLVGQPGFSVGDSTLTRVTLKKRNRFFSQWCGAAPTNGPAFQQAATRPSRNLFLDPYSDYLPGGNAPVDTGTVDATAEADSFTAARLQPVLNVARADFEAAQFFNGSSTELAGRGLYGDYSLFFPADFLSSNGGNGLVLGLIDDVLLRFDYVSVAQ